MKYTSSTGVSLNLTPWMDNGYKFVETELIEAIGGSIARGKIILESDGSKESLDLVTSEFGGHLTLKNEIDGGFVTEIDLFITEKSYIKNYLTLNFLCIKDKSFFTDLIISEWDDIDSALNSLYPGKVDIKTTSDLGNSIKIFQATETNYSLCSKLALSYKRGTVFSYGLEGLVIKDVIAEDEPKTLLGPQSGIFNLTPYNLVYNKFLYQEPENPWEDKEKVSNNLEVLTDYSKYYFVGKEYQPLLKNYLYNRRYINESLYSYLNITTNSLPPYKIGEVIQFKDLGQEEKLPFDLFLVTENRVFMAVDGGKTDQNGYNLSTTTILSGIQENGSTLPEKDPTSVNK